MRKEDKSTVVAQLSEMIASYPHFYLVDVEGMNAQQTSDLRRKCFNGDMKMVVVKNSLLQKAFDAAETDYSPLSAVLKGTTAMVFTQTGNAPAKMLKEYASKKAEKPALKAAFVEQMSYVGADQLNVLAAIKSKNELIADVIAALESPIMNVLSALENREAQQEAAE